MLPVCFLILLWSANNKCFPDKIEIAMKFSKVIIFLLFIVSVSSAQTDKLTIEVTGYGGGATDSLQPLWNWADQWGIFTPMTRGEGVFTGKVYYHFIDRKNVSMKAGVAGALKTDWGESFVQEAFLRMKFWWFDVSGGMEAYSPVAYDDNLASGIFLISSNARPVPKVIVGIFDYLPLGFTKKWVEIRGAMTQGFLWDDRGLKGNSDVLLHEKWAYVRLGNLKWKPYAGLVHSALFGGTKPNGEKIPIDFWATFTASGSAKLGGGEETNAAGAHMGLWDFGLYFPLKKWQGQLYYQKPFVDGSGMHLFRFYNKDFFLGILLKNKNKSKHIITGISMELIKTSWGCGPGTMDPYDPEENHIVFIGDIDDVDAYMLERFGIETNNWDHHDLKEFLKVEWNHGHNFGGRDPYLNNGMYYAGWSYDGLSMGTPLFHSSKQFQKYAKGWYNRDGTYFVNNRIKGFNIGVEGWFIKNLYYRFKGTFTNNHGSYIEQYSGGHSWEEQSNYYFAESKNQFYTGLELTWQPKKELPLTLVSVLGYDFGELYHTFGGRIGIKYRIAASSNSH